MLDQSGTSDAIEDYLAALQLLESAAGDADVIIPGHGSIGRTDEVQARIKQDRATWKPTRGPSSRDPRIDPSST